MRYKRHLELRRRGQWFGMSKRKKTICIKMGKQMFGKHMCAGPCGDSGAQSGL